MLSQELYSISRSVFRAIRIRSLAFSWATRLCQLCWIFLSVFSTGEWGIGLKIFFHTAYYFTHNLIPFLFVIYILFLTDGYKEMSALFKSFLYTPMIVDLLLVITTPVTHFIIYVDSQGGYHRGTLQPFTYIVAILLS